MHIRDFFKPRPPRRNPPLLPASSSDASARLSLRDWADLPTHHPRPDGTATR